MSSTAWTAPVIAWSALEKDRDVGVSRDDVLGGLQAERRRIERLAGSDDDLDLRMGGEASRRPS